MYAGMLLGENWSKVEAVGHNATLLVGVVLVLLGILWMKSQMGSGLSSREKAHQGL